MLNEQMMTLLNAVNNKKQALYQHKDSFNQCKFILNQKLKEQLNYIQHSTENMINELQYQSKEFQEILKERYQVKLNSIEQLIIENEKYVDYVNEMERNALLCQGTLVNQSKTIYDVFIESRRIIVKNWEEFIFNYNKTKIYIRDKSIFDEERFIIHSNYKKNQVFNFANNKKTMNPIDVNEEKNDDNKENTPMKMRNFITKRIIHTVTQSTIENTNNISIKNQSQKGSFPNNHLNLSNQQQIIKQNSL